MKFYKSCQNNWMLLTVLVALYTGGVSAFKCGLSKHQHTPSSSSEYNITHKEIISTNPEAQVQVVKYTPKHAENHVEKMFYVLKSPPKFKEDANNIHAKENGLKTIIKVLNGKSPAKTPVLTHNTPTPYLPHDSTVSTSTPSNNYKPHQNGQHYVYNIQNHGTHHHYYGSPTATANTQPSAIGFVPLEKANNRNASQWLNTVPLNK